MVSMLATTFGTDTSVPSVITDMTISGIELAFTSTAKEQTIFNFSAATEATICGQSLDLQILIQTAFSENSYSNLFSAELSVGGNVFSGTLETGTDDSKLAVSWSDQNTSTALTLNDLISEFGFTLPEIVSDLDLTLTAASLSYDFTTTALTVSISTQNYGDSTLSIQKNSSDNSTTEEWIYSVTLAVGSEMLSPAKLPIIGTTLPDGISFDLDSASITITNNPQS